MSETIMNKTKEEDLGKYCSKIRSFNFNIKVDEKRKAYQKVDLGVPTFNIHRGIQEIDPEAFENYETLEILIFQDQQIKVGEFAFAACENLKEIRIQKNPVSDWNNSTTKGIQFKPGIFGGCVNLKNRANLPAIAEPFFKLHFEGLQCYAEINGDKKGLEIDKWKYTAMPEKQKQDVLAYLILFNCLSNKNCQNDLINKAGIYYNICEN